MLEPCSKNNNYILNATPNFIIKKSIPKLFENISYPSWENKFKKKKLWTLDKTRLGSSSKSSSRFGFEAGSRAGS
jgi:hypothetical protein